MDKSKNAKIKSARIRFGKRTYFFDISISKNNKKYLKITESQFVEEGKDRVYNSLVLFPENVIEFQKNFEEMAASLL